MSSAEEEMQSAFQDMASEVGSHSITLRMAGQSQPVTVDAVREDITDDTRNISQITLETSEVRFEVAIADLSQKPERGDEIEYDGNRYFVNTVTDDGVTYAIDTARAKIEQEEKETI